jgi:hypothetical protein
MYLLLAVLFGSGFVYNVMADPIDWLETSATCAISCLMISMFFWIRISHARSQRTIIWLLKNKDRITKEAQHFPDAPVFDQTISQKTKLRSFKIVTSVIFLTTESELGLEIRTGIWAGFFATAWTLLMGWWGFPWGPIRTIRALIHNLGGGKTMTVDYVILRAETGIDFESI